MSEKNWNDTTPEERTCLLSPWECSLLEKIRGGSEVLLVAPEYAEFVKRQAKLLVRLLSNYSNPNQFLAYTILYDKGDTEFEKALRTWLRDYREGR